MLRRVVGWCGALALALGLPPAYANSPSVVVTYEFAYNGIVSLDVGRATVQYTAAGPGYQLALSFRPSASARSFAVGPGIARSAGAISPHGLSPRSVSLDYSVRSLAETRSFTMAGDRLQTVHITKKKSGGLFKAASSVAYDPRLLPAYAPLSEAEQRNVLDPMSAMLLPIAGKDALDRANCQRRLRIYDGRRRFDLQMSYEGVENGATGEAVVCNTTYVPIAGHSLDKDAFNDAIRDYHIVVSLVAAPGTNFLIPSRIIVTDNGGVAIAEAKAIAISGR
jgi:hypothetical protein